MIDFTLLRGSRTEKGAVVLEVETGGVAQKWIYRDTRGAFVWEPIPYYVILGELAPSNFDAPNDKRGPFYILDEHESSSLSLNDFFSRFTDSLSLLCTNDIYGDLKKKEYSDLFYSYQDKMRLNLSLIAAPFFDNFRIAMSQTQDTINDGLLRIPKGSLVWNQLEIFNPSDIENEPERRFHRLRALAFGICGFLKFKPVPILTVGSIARHRGDSWMV